MNSFDKKFFRKYIPENSSILETIHTHIISVINQVFLWISLGALIPSFLYSVSYRIQEYIPFYWLEIWIFIIFIKVIYDVFDWYLDVWIITDDGIYDLRWKLLKIDITSVKFESIEGIEIEQYGIWDKVWNKGDLILHQVGSDGIRKINAESPFKSSEILEGYIHGHDDHNDDKKDRFDLILDALGGIVDEYLERKGIREKIDDEDDIIGLDPSSDTIDLRSESEKNKIQEKLKKRLEKKASQSHGESKSHSGHNSGHH